jgi:rhamnogalacturonyl hydrolase YesR
MCTLTLDAAMTIRQESLCNRESIKSVMKRVVNFQVNAFAGKHNTGWTVATFYSGVIAAFQATGDETFYKSAKAWCETANWKLSGSTYNADDICIGQTFLDIYFEDKREFMIADIKAALENYFNKKVITKREFIYSIWNDQHRPFTGRNLWWWCDALYMAPPVMARMYAATGQKRYLELMHTLYWDSTAYLFDKEEGLYFRDADYFNAKTPKGKKVFWGRGNGWVYAGLMRMIDYIPEYDPKKQMYIDLFRTMTRSILEYQQPDGLWRSSLNEPGWIKEKESSSSSFFCYGLLAGINKGYLDKKAYLPAALRAWEGLLGCINTDGRLGYAQLIGKDPKHNRPQDFVDYAHGAFLLAASELYKMNLTPEDFIRLNPPYEIKQLVADGAWTWFNDERAIIEDNTLIIGSVDSKGVSRVDLYKIDAEYSSQVNHEYPLSSWKSKDDHNNPALLKVDKNTFLACYAQHDREKKWYYRLAKMTGWDIYRHLDWDAEKTFTVPAATTYNNLVQLSAENNRIYHFSRNSGYNPCLTYSDDGGHKWQGQHILIKSGNVNTRPYVKYCSNSKDRIDFMYTDGHPRDEPNNNVYHFFYKAGHFYRTDGRPIKSFEEMKKTPLTPADGTLIYDGSTAGRGWIWDVECDKQGNPIAVFITSADHAEGKDLRYHYARWDDKIKRWQQWQIAFAGSRLYVPENHYSGGISIDPDDTSVVYISSNVEPDTGKPNSTGRYQVYRGVTTDRSKTRNWQQLTFDPHVDNLRPFVPRKHRHKICVIWLRGKYHTYTDYHTEIAGILEKK